MKSVNAWLTPESDGSKADMSCQMAQNRQMSGATRFPNIRKDRHDAETRD